MKKTGMFTLIVLIVAAAVSMNCYARDLNAQVSVLEQRAKILERQIENAQSASHAALDSQVSAIRRSIDNLTQQRVRVDQHIAQLEQQLDTLKTQSQMTLDRQVQQYNRELNHVKAQLSSLVGEKAEKGAPSSAAKPEVKSEAVKKEAPQVQGSVKSGDKEAQKTAAK